MRRSTNSAQTLMSTAQNWKKNSALWDLNTVQSITSSGKYKRKRLSMTASFVISYFIEK